MMKRIFAVFAAVLLTAAVFPAAADLEWDDSSGEYIWVDELAKISLRRRRDTFTLSGLGAAPDAFCAVLSAPFEDAWRPDGAGIGAGEPFTVLATAENGKWSMIEYDIPGGAKRIGWARIPNVPTAWGDEFPTIDARLCTLTRDVSLTDDPNGTAVSVMDMRAGDTVVALGVIDRWAYVRTKVGGRVAWLFTEADALDFEPCWTVDEDGVLRVREGVTRIGLPVCRTVDENGDDVRTEPLQSDDISAPGLNRGISIPDSVRAIVFPDSIRSLGNGSVYGSYDHILIPDLPDGVDWDVFYAVETDTLALTADCLDFSILRASEYVTVRAFEVEEGSPFFKAVDGVLFSADGKKLIAYPNGAPAEHYTVPAGVEEICERAFCDDMMSFSLKTISLPIGLKKIGEYAFSGCGRLISLTVPLTVTELSENAFWDCVSLERLSLPPGLSVSFNTNWAVRGDFTRYNGDNGTTYTEAETDHVFFEYDGPGVDVRFAARLDTPDGLGTVPWYVSADAAEPAGEEPAGTEVYIHLIENGRARMSDGWDRENGTYFFRWYTLESLVPISGDPFFIWADDGETLRVQTGDSRTLGVLQAAAPLSPIRLLDAPEGSELAHFFDGEQAEVLGSENGWLRVRTVRCEGWIPENCFREIFQAED